MCYTCFICDIQQVKTRNKKQRIDCDVELYGHLEAQLIFVVPAATLQTFVLNSWTSGLPI